MEYLGLMSTVSSMIWSMSTPSGDSEPLYCLASPLLWTLRMYWVTLRSYFGSGTSFMTKMRSAFLIVESLWAMTKLVLP